MPDITPVPLPDEGEAGTLWRIEKLRDFEWRIKCLGLQDDPLLAELATQIREQTEKVEALWEEQRNPEYERKWWQDGEYDAVRADDSNSAGMEYFKDSKYGAAFEAFTEAIRLCPTSAVYHCNRAAAALKLNQPQIAAEDAENALDRDGSYLKAVLRAGRARLVLQQSQAACQHFQRALEIDPTNSAALKGIQEVKELEQAQHDEEVANEATAAAGTRTALPRNALSEEEAALQLYSAETMLESNPKNEALKCGAVEGLILCRRYSDALARCQDLRPGIERSYLESEALWRSGDLVAAVNSLKNVQQQRIESNKKTSEHSQQKCADLKVFLDALIDKLEYIDNCIDEGLYADAGDACSEMLSQLDPGACCGLFNAILCRRANSAAHRSMWEDAMGDLDRALELQPWDAGALRMRADVSKQMGAYIEYFLDLQRLKKAAPGTSGLAALLEDAAKLCSGCSEFGSRGTGGASARAVSGPLSAFEALGVRSGTSAADVRKAYLKLATSWHPDKWATASDAERERAEEKFKKVQAAYEVLASG